MAATASREISVPSVLDRILCGIDGSPEALELLVVGNRGRLHGLSALGSVSERLAQRATCSVLVVRQRR